MRAVVLMSSRRPPEKSLLVVAAFSRHVAALDWALERLQVEHGPLAMVSPDFAFHHTHYYDATMGTGLLKRLFVFEPLRESDILPLVKRQTIDLERELAVSARFSESRPLNLDPGLLQLGKFLLASTKDQAHRIYLGNNTYAEVTLRFQGKEFEPWPWTYADYREPAVRAFLRDARNHLYHRVHPRVG
jgi:hypothetical protein